MALRLNSQNTFQTFLQKEIHKPETQTEKMMSYSEIKVSQIELNQDQTIELESRHIEQNKSKTMKPVKSATKVAKKPWFQCFIESPVNLLK